MPEANRQVKHKVLGTTEADGANGWFVFDHYKVDGYLICCQVSDGMGWEHVSVTIATKVKGRKVERCPTWGEMCWVKNQFWEQHEVVMQLHPPKELHVSTHPYCLHLWAPIGVNIPVPHPSLVGVLGDDIQTFSK